MARFPRHGQIAVCGVPTFAVLVPAAREPEAPAGTDPDMTAIEVYVAEMTATAPAAVRERPGQAPWAAARLTARAVQIEPAAPAYSWSPVAMILAYPIFGDTSSTRMGPKAAKGTTCKNRASGPLSVPSGAN